MQLNLKHLGNNYVLPKNCQPGTNWIALNYTEKPIVCELRGLYTFYSAKLKRQSCSVLNPIAFQGAFLFS